MDWSDKTHLFSKYTRRGYYLACVEEETPPDKTFQLKVIPKPMNIQVGYMKEKYGIIIKRANETINEALSTNHYCYQDPWADGDYDKCRNITIRNTDSITHENEPCCGLNQKGFTVNLSRAATDPSYGIRIYDEACGVGGNTVGYQEIRSGTGWVEVTFMVNTTAGQNLTYSEYYDNADATNPNYPLIRYFYEGFDDSNIYDGDPMTWQWGTVSGQANSVIVDGVLILENDTSGSDAFLFTNGTTFYDDLSVFFWYKVTDANRGPSTYLSHNASPITATANSDQAINYNGNFWMRYYDGGFTNFGSSDEDYSPTVGAWQKWGIWRWTNDSMYVYATDNTPTSWNYHIYGTDATTPNEGIIGFNAYLKNISWDNISIYNGTVNEYFTPLTATLGDEETGSISLAINACGMNISDQANVIPGDIVRLWASYTNSTNGIDVAYVETNSSVNNSATILNSTYFYYDFDTTGYGAEVINFTYAFANDTNGWVSLACTQNFNITTTSTTTSTTTTTTSTTSTSVTTTLANTSIMSFDDAAANITGIASLLSAMVSAFLGWIPMILVFFMFTIIIWLILWGKSQLRV